ncbi:MAG TPA: hypothetical protein VKG23_17790 [Thermoanaerobaculia bacterium]|nr:hypothetical protein [Thermoanaerobaculia bacterium]
MTTETHRDNYVLRTWRLARNGGRLRALRWLIMYALGRLVAVRRLARFARTRRRPLLVAEPAMLSRLRRDGLDWSMSLPAATVGRLVERASELASSCAYPAAGNDRAVALLDEIAARSGFLAVATAYLERPARYAGSRMWWLGADSSAGALSTGAVFHYDLYDYGALVFLCYLTDVGGSGGAHVCVRSSHRRRRLKDQLRLRRHWTDGEVASRYPVERIVTVTGPAGTVIAEDPFCIHKAIAPAEGRRLAVQFLYTASDFPAPSFRPPGLRTSTTR